MNISSSFSFEFLGSSRASRVSVAYHSERCCGPRGRLFDYYSFTLKHIVVMYIVLCMLYVWDCAKYTHINCAHVWYHPAGPEVGWLARRVRLGNFMLIRIINRPSGYELSKINDSGIQFAQFAARVYHSWFFISSCYMQQQFQIFQR